MQKGEQKLKIFKLEIQHKNNQRKCPHRKCRVEFQWIPVGKIVWNSTGID